MEQTQAISFNTPNPVSAANLVFNPPSSNNPRYRSDGQCWCVENSGGFNFSVIMPNATGMLLTLTLCGETSYNQLIGIIDIVVNGKTAISAYKLESNGWYTKSWFLPASYFNSGTNTLSINLNSSTQLNGIWLQNVAAKFETFQFQTIDLSVANPSNKSSFSFPQPQSPYVTFIKSYNCWQNFGVGASIKFQLNMAKQIGVNLILNLCASTVNGYSTSAISISVNGTVLVAQALVSNQNFVPFSWFIQSSLLKVGNNDILVTLVSYPNVTPIWINAATAQIFEMQHQQQSNWCWSACTTSVSVFYNSLSNWTQCTLVNQAFGSTTACTDGGNSVNNKGWYNKESLQITGNFSSQTPGAASLDVVKAQALIGAPISASIYWGDGTGHAVMVIGYFTGDMVGIEDPWYGTSYISYTQFCQKYKGVGVWGNTDLTKGE